MSVLVSSINEYLFCPLKLYLRHHLEFEKSEKKYSAKDNILIFRQVYKDYNDIVRKNLRMVKKDMNASQISEILFQDVNYLLKKSMKGYNFDSEKEKLLRLNQLENDLKVKNTILALKIHRILNKTKNTSIQIVEMLFPPSLESYLIRDKSLEMGGIVDRIEIIGGKYYPISQKSKNPPLRGVWDSDALEIAAYALLIEQEFDTEVLVGFVDYQVLEDRRPVVVDSELREGLFIVLDDIRNIINYGNLPEVNINPKKCETCNYKEICNQNLEFS